MDAPARPWPPPLGTYAEERELFRLLQNMLKELLIHKPNDPIEFMIDHLKQHNDDGSKWHFCEFFLSRSRSVKKKAPRVCVLGPPASGKTTVARWLCKHLGAIRISRETLLSKGISALVKEAKAYKERNQEIPNELWANLIQKRLSNVDCIKQGWILEGFPENQEQAWMLQSSGIIPRHVVVLYASDTVLIERNSGKRLDPITEEVYHTTFDWPTDPLVQQRLVKPEDLSEQDMSKKLLEYHRNFPEVFQIYQKVLKLINADQPSMDVLSQVLTCVRARHRSAAPFTPRVLFCGPPGSGKSLQAALIAQKYSLVNICCGQLLKEAVAGKTKLGELVKPYLDSGSPGYFSFISPMNPSWNDCLNGGLIPSRGKDTTAYSDQHPPQRSKPVSGRTPEMRKKILSSVWRPMTGMPRTWRTSMKMPFMSMLTKTHTLSLSL
ncbi:adenylate kinase 8 isoform X5 [Apus apus]|uniref:adenylate kinase 8 isoform X5 n=1 Tax=Apus apus TaxID=8895 RepID=UPI0021F8C0AB|nr:adenylate kinase 8 isoform X5 [Apus apus]